MLRDIAFRFLGILICCVAIKIKGQTFSDNVINKSDCECDANFENIIARLDIDQLYGLQSPACGDKVYIADLKEIYCFNGAYWLSVDKMKNSISGLRTILRDSNLTLESKMPQQGLYKVGVPMSIFNYINISLKSNKVGQIHIKTNKVNGVYFEAIAEFSDPTKSTLVKLLGVGIPVQSGNFNYTLNFKDTVYQIQVTFQPPKAEVKSDVLKLPSRFFSVESLANEKVTDNAFYVSVYIVPTKTGAFQLSSNSQCGITYFGAAVLEEKDLHQLTEVRLYPKGAIASYGVYEYTLTSGLVTADFKVRYMPPKQQFNVLEASRPNQILGNGSHRFAIDVAGQGTLILKGSVAVWSNADSNVSIRIKHGEVLIAEQTMMQPMHRFKWQIFPFMAEYKVDNSTSCFVDVYLDGVQEINDLKLSYVFLPQSALYPDSNMVLSGVVKSERYKTNAFGGKCLEFRLKCPSSGLFTIWSLNNSLPNDTCENMHSKIYFENLLIGASNLHVRQNDSVWHHLNTWGVFSVNQAGDYLIRVELYGTSQIQNSCLNWLFVDDKNSEIQQQFINERLPNNMPSNGSHRLLLNAPAAGKFIVQGSCVGWNNNIGTKGVGFYAGNELISNALLKIDAPHTSSTVLPFFFEYKVYVPGSYSIDIVPLNLNDKTGLSDIHLNAVFVKAEK